MIPVYFSTNTRAWKQTVLQGILVYGHVGAGS